MSDPGFWVLAAIALAALVFVAVSFPMVVRYHRAWKRWQAAMAVLRPLIEAMQPALVALAETFTRLSAAMESFTRSAEAAMTATAEPEEQRS